MPYGFHNVEDMKECIIGSVKLFEENINASVNVQLKWFVLIHASRKTMSQLTKLLLTIGEKNGRCGRAKVEDEKIRQGLVLLKELNLIDQKMRQHKHAYIQFISQKIQSGAFLNPFNNGIGMDIAPFVDERIVLQQMILHFIME